MSRELNYIISAFFLLLTAAGLFFFIQKIPAGKSVPQTVQPGASSESVNILSGNAAMGKAIFNSKCASCHILFKDGTGPDLSAVIDGEQWSDQKKLYAWIKNPVAFMKTDKYVQGLRTFYDVTMPGFPDMSDREIDAIVEYIRYSNKIKNVPMPMASL